DPDVLLREAALLGSEQGWDVLRVPAFPAGREPFRILAVASQPRPAPVAGWLHATTTGWATFLDARGAAMTTPDGRPMYVWGPVALPAPSEVRFAVRIQEPALDVWLNRAGADYGVPVTAPQAVTWIGDPWVAQDGLSRMAPGAGLYVGHDTTVYESTWPQSPDVTVLVRWSVDGVDQLPITMAVTAVDDGQFAANTRWEATLPTARLAPGAVVRWKLVGRSVGPDVADDDGGGWYQRTVEPAPEVAWMDQGVYTFSQCHWDGVTCFTGWAWDADLPEPLDATPGQFQAYAAAPLPGVELYVPGVTDAADWDPATSAFLRVEVVSPFFDEDPAGSWLPHPMRWAEAAGPNLRYQWEIRDFHAPTMPATGAMCPADGLYAYRFRVSADGGTTWATLGTADWGAGWGADCTMTWGTFLQAPPVTLQPSGPLDLGAVAVGAQGTAQVTLVNTNNQTLDLTGWSFDDPSGAWTASWVGCPDATACSLRLASGAQKTLRVAFTPAAPGPVTTTLRATRSAPGVCAGDEPFELQVLATSR
ncbi:MAG TPA: hypothetical protein PKA64_22480, partial [Myxococcota bacterium]|nr:hypothetical protein [Myxococcota bacterium]